MPYAIQYLKKKKKKKIPPALVKLTFWLRLVKALPKPDMCKRNRNALRGDSRGVELHQWWRSSSHACGLPRSGSVGLPIFGWHDGQCVISCQKQSQGSRVICQKCWKNCQLCRSHTLTQSNHACFNATHLLICCRLGLGLCNKGRLTTRGSRGARVLLHLNIICIETF